MARVDVLIPAYNAGRTIAIAVASMQAQTLRDIRILVLNDGSTDDTGNIARALAAEDPRIEVIEQANAGIVDARNVLLAHARAPVLAFLDADDTALPERLEKQLAYLDANADCVAVACDAWFIDDRGQRSGGGSSFAGDVAPDAFALPSVEPYLPQSCVTLRRAALQAIGGYRHLTNAEDTDMFWRLLDRGRLHCLAERLGEYRQHSDSVSSASTQSGRISAISSQLAALSYRRRAAGRPDFAFPSEQTDRLRALPTLEDMLGAVVPELDAAEREWLRLAVAAKLVELASYRPYLLSRADCRFLRTALPEVRRRATAGQRRHLVYREAQVLRKLLAAGCWREAGILRAPVTAWLAIGPAFLARKVKAAMGNRLVAARG